MVKDDEIYSFLLNIKELNDDEYNMLVDTYGFKLVSNIMRKMILDDSGNVEKFAKYLLNTSDNCSELTSMFEYYSNDISMLDNISEMDAEKLLNEILSIIKDLNILFENVGCNDNILGKCRKPWINDKVEYCLKKCFDKELLDKVNKLYNLYVIKRNKFLEGYLRFVIFIASDYVREDVLSFVDLIQYGNLGLIRAIETYNPKFNTKFTTYAGDWIIQSIIRNMENNMYQIRKPIHMFEQNLHRVRVINLLLYEFGREPTELEIAKYMGITLEEVQFIRQAFLDTCSIDELIETSIDDVFVTRCEYIVDDSVDVEEEAINGCLSRELNKCMLKYLTERERFVLYSKYYKMMNYPEISRMLGVTYQRVTQIHNDAIKKLRRKKEIKKWNVI